MASRFTTNAPKTTVWLIAVIIGFLGILATLTPLGELSANAFWLVAIGFIILTVATAVKGL